MGTLRPCSMACECRLFTEGSGRAEPGRGWAVIDLDQPAQHRTPASEGARRRLATPRALILVVVGSLLAGGVMGGVAPVALHGTPWNESRRRGCAGSG
jgi:hypothetical protein